MGFFNGKKIIGNNNGNLCHKFMARGHLSSYWYEVTRRRVRLAECNYKIMYSWNYQPLVYNTAQIYLLREKIEVLTCMLLAMLLTVSDKAANKCVCIYVLKAQSE